MHKLHTMNVHSLHYLRYKTLADTITLIGVILNILFHKDNMLFKYLNVSNNNN